MAGCGGDDGQGKETKGPIRFIDGQPVDKILAKAVYLSALQERGEENAELLYSPNGEALYTGWVKEVRQNGKLKGLSHFKNGEKDGPSATWHESGSKQSEEHWLGGKQDGMFTTWHENEQKKGESHWKNGKRVETWETWHENGQSKSTGEYKDDKQEGVWIHYNEDGTEKRRTIYSGGIPF